MRALQRDNGTRAAGDGDRTNAAGPQRPASQCEGLGTAVPDGPGPGGVAFLADVGPAVGVVPGGVAVTVGTTVERVPTWIASGEDDGDGSRDGLGAG